MKQEHSPSLPLVRWRPQKPEWDFDPSKPFLVEILKRAIFSDVVDVLFLQYFKNSLAVMCEAWLKRRGIDPAINTSKNYHALQDEFYIVLAHINRGFETEAQADWKAGVGLLMSLWKNIEANGTPHWIDHKRERRKGDPASRFELTAEPKQDVSDAFWISMFKKGRKTRESIFAAAQRVDSQQARYFQSLFDLDEHKTFTETVLTMITTTQETWLDRRLSAKLGLARGYSFYEETFGASIPTMKQARKIVESGIAQLWLINNFFKLYRRDWNYLLESLTGGHHALDRLFGSIIVTLALGRDRKTFEVREDDAEEFFEIFWRNNLTMPFSHAFNVARQLHEGIIASEEYSIFLKATALLRALARAENESERPKTLDEGKTILQMFDPWVKEVISFPLSETAGDFSDLNYPIVDDEGYARLLEKLKCLLKLEMNVHAVVESSFWYVVETFGDLVRAYRIQQKKKLTPEERSELNRIAQENHLMPGEKNYLMYAPDRCYIGKELRYFREGPDDRARNGLELRFEKKTQQSTKHYITPPLRVRRELNQRCGRYGKLIGTLYDRDENQTRTHVKMIWNFPKIQITDLDCRATIRPRTFYEITITSAEPRKPRERWE
ncbi:MAG TPA: hypothetical protein PKM59_00650 [Thermodesulfobacteriota bacterium]|nr:hypothetical protein [Thermodesulfobacteriota bacterium]